MTTKSILLFAILSVLSFGAFATADSVKVNYLGTEAENLIDSIPTFTVGDQIVVKGEFSNPAGVSAVTIDLLDDNWWTAPNTAMTYDISEDGTLDIVYTVPEETPLSFFPDSSTNTQIRLRVMISYTDGDAFSFHRINTYPVDGVYPEIEEPEPSDVPTITDVVDIELNIYNGTDTVTQGMSGWTNMSPIQPGDVLHFTGTYEPLVGEDGYIHEVHTNISYLGSDWGDGPFLLSNVVASAALGNADGIVDFKMVVPYFIPESLLYGHDDYVGVSDDLHPLVQIRMVYSNDPVIAGWDGTKGTYNTYVNWWGPVHNYEGEKPETCANVSGIQVTSLSDTSVVVTWDLANDAVWDVVLAPEGTVRNPDSQPFVTKSGLPAVITGLDPDTEYDVWVRSVCDPNEDTRMFGDYVKLGESGTSVANIHDLINGVCVYPNPSNGILTVDTDADYLIDVRDLSGRTVLQTSTIAKVSEQLDLTSFSNGIYLIQFSNDKIAFTKKFIKQ